MVEMHFNVLKQDIRAFEDRYSQKECESIAVGKKGKAFGGIFSGIKRLVSSSDTIILVRIFVFLYCSDEFFKIFKYNLKHLD